MCRLMTYMGDSVPLEDLLYRPDASLVRQAVEPQLMSLLNLGGFGFAAWVPGTRDLDTPLTYRGATIPTFDRNLQTLAAKLEAAALVAHVHGVGYSSRELLHGQCSWLGDAGLGQVSGCMPQPESVSTPALQLRVAGRRVTRPPAM